MKVSAKTVRTLFGFQAAFFVVMLGVFLYYVSRFSVVVRSGPFSPKYVFGAFLVLSIPCTLSGIAWYRLRYSIPNSQVWTFLACLASLLFPVLGVATCILGLIVFGPKPSKAKPPPRYFPEDEINRYLENALTAASLASWMAAAYYWHRWGAQHALRAVDGWAWWAQLGAAIFLSVLIHELGHAMAGWMVRMKLLRFQAGPLRIQFQDGRVRIRPKAIGLIGGIGAAAMAPLDLRNTRGRLVFMAIGGPLASLLCAVSCAVLALSAKGNFWERGWEFFAIVSACSCSHFLFRLVPVWSATDYSDGAVILQLIRTGPWADVHVAFSMVETSNVTKIRPRDWDIEAIKRSTAFVASGIKGVQLRGIAYLHYLDTDQSAEARRCLFEAESIYPLVAKQCSVGLHADFVYFHALYDRDRRKAEMWWDRMEAKKGPSDSVDYYKAYAALRFVQNRMDEAREACLKGLEFADTLAEVGANEANRSDLLRLQRVLATCTELVAPQAWLAREQNTSMIR